MRNKAKPRPIGRGNVLLGIKHPGGRPPKYETQELIWEAAEAYFARCTRFKVLPEKAGLCFALGIARDTYNDWRKKKQFSATIKRTDQYIESCWAQRLSGQAATGAIFYLKNAFRADFRDRHETDVTSGGERITGMVISKEA